MHKFTGTDGSAVKSHNIRAILLTLLRHEQASRAQLAQLTHLSATTVTNLVTDLLKQGVIAEDDRATTPQRRGVGRPQTALRLVPDARYAIGIHFDVDHINIAITDLYAHPLHSVSLAHAPEQSADSLLAETARLVREAVAASGVRVNCIVGVGVGASGLVDPDTGVNVISPNLGWRDVPLRRWLSEQLALPVRVENNVRAMALGEVLFGAGRGSYTLAFVYARVGVGAGFVVDGDIYRGSGAGAGEIGHTTIIPVGGERCRCGNTGCLETLVSEPAILRQARQRARQSPTPLLAEALAQAEGERIERIFAAARAGDPAACDLLAECAGYMGVALANLINVLNPEQIVLGGLFAQGRDVLLPTVERVIRERAFANLGAQVSLQTTAFGYQAGVIGAAALALDTFFYRGETPG
jgi:glucokinase-like ROK family protein